MAYLLLICVRKHKMADQMFTAHLCCHVDHLELFSTTWVQSTNDSFLHTK